MKPQALLGILVIAYASHASAQDVVETGEHVSIIQLIAAPERYHGKLVFLSAFVTVRREDMSLCMVREKASSKDCLWLEIDDGPYETAAHLARFKAAEKKWLPLHGKRVSVHGTFNMENTGHFGMWSGALENIRDVYADRRSRVR